MQHIFRSYIQLLGIAMILCVTAFGQDVVRDLKIPDGGHVEVVNHFGRVIAKAVEPAKEGEVIGGTPKAISSNGLSDNEIKISSAKVGMLIVVTPNDPKKRVDIILELPVRSSIKIETTTGAVDVMGDLAKIEVVTDTGRSITTDIPDDELE